MNRKEARIEAFGLIFQLNADSDVDSLISLYKEDKTDTTQTQYILDSVTGVANKLGELDAIIEKNLKAGWKTNRLSKVSLAVLRLAVYEILYVDDVPPTVAINEAIEITKEYDDPKNSTFVNGVLGGVYKEYVK